MVPAASQLNEELLAEDREMDKLEDLLVRELRASCSRCRANLAHIRHSPLATWGRLVRCGANMAHRRQSKPGYGLGVQFKVLQTFCNVPSSPGREWLVVAPL